MIQTARRTAMDHIRELSVGIGPRPSTGAGEREAAEYIRSVMETIAPGSARVHPFRCLVSGWRPFAWASAMALAAEGLFLVGGAPGAVAAIVICASAFVFAILQLLFIPNPLMAMVGKGDSQNVWMKIPAGGEPGAESDAKAKRPVEPRQRLVITSHYDTHRTPLAYSSPFWIKVFRSLTTAGMGAYLMLIVLFAVALVAGAGSGPAVAAKWISLLPGAIHLLVLGLTFEADTTPHTPGANDNASGAGVLLELAARLTDKPLAGTEVWIVATGCEEVGLYGAQAFFADFKTKLQGAMQINIDNIAGTDCGPCYIDEEKMLATYHSDPELLALADAITADRPDLGARRTSYQGAYTDGAIGIKHGLPAITFLGLDRTGWIPNVHQMTDVIEHCDPAVVERVTDFIETLARRIDTDRPHEL